MANGVKPGKTTSMCRWTFVLLLLLAACIDNDVSLSETKEPSLLIGLSLQQHKNSRPGLDGYLDGLDYAVHNGINIFGMSPTWRELEPLPNVYALQDYLANPLNLTDPDKTKLNSYVLVLKMIDTNVKLLPADLTSLSFDSPVVINRFALLLEKIFLEVPSIERVSHILIGNEIDGYLTNHPDELQRFKTFYAAAVSKIHTLNPRARVGTILTFEAAKKNTALFDTFKDTGDFICYTYYPTNDQLSVPWQMRPPSEVAADIDWMVKNASGKPIAFTEIGYTSHDGNSSSEQQQAEFVEAMFRSMQPHVDDNRIEFVYYHGMYDYPTGFCTGYAAAQGVGSDFICGFMNHLGLHDWETSKAKPAWRVFVNELQKINAVR